MGRFKIKIKPKISSLYNKLPTVRPDLKSLKDLPVPKTDLELRVHLDKIKNPKLKNILKTGGKITLGGVAAGTAVGLSSKFINDYVIGNSGCFLEKENGEVCKMNLLSCCNPNESSYVKSCSADMIQRLGIPENACDQYDETHPNCCRKCENEQYNFQKDEKLVCRRANTAQALSYFANNVTSSIAQTVLGTLSSILTSPFVLKLLFTGLAIFIIAILGYKYILTK